MTKKSNKKKNRLKLQIDIFQKWGLQKCTFEVKKVHFLQREKSNG